MKKKLISLLLAVAMVVSMVPAVAVSAVSAESTAELTMEQSWANPGDLLFMKCTICIDSETGECQVLSARVADFVRCVLFVPAKGKTGAETCPRNRPPTVLRHCCLVGEVNNIICN